MECLNFQDLEQVIDKEKAAGKTIGLFRTTGGLHKGHLELCSEARKHCDIIIVLFCYYMRHLNHKDVTCGRFEHFYNDDLLKLKDIVQYSVKIRATPQIRSDFKWFREKCLPIFSWLKGDMWSYDNAYFMKRMVVMATPLPFEDVLSKCDFYFQGEKNITNAYMSMKLSTTIYDDKAPPHMFFPVSRHPSGATIDSGDMGLSVYGLNLKQNEVGSVVQEIRELVTKDFTKDEILKKVRNSFDSFKVLDISYLTLGNHREPFKGSPRISQCTPTKVLTYLGNKEASHSRTVYQIEDIRFTEENLVDSSGNYVI